MDENRMNKHWIDQTFDDVERGLRMAAWLAIVAASWKYLGT